MKKKTPKQRWNKAVNTYKKVNRTNVTVKAKQKLKVPRMTKLAKIIKPQNAFRAFKLVREADETIKANDMLIEKAVVTWTVRFGDRASIVVENVMKVLGAVQANINAGKNPLSIAQGKEQDLVDLLAGARALQATGTGSSVALHSYMQQVAGQKQGLTPEQVEIAAVKQAGRGSRVSPEVQQQLQQLAQAIQTGDAAAVEAIKRQFQQTFSFYQQLQQRMAPQQQTPVPAQRQPVMPTQRPAQLPR